MGRKLAGKHFELADLLEPFLTKLNKIETNAELEDDDDKMMQRISASPKNSFGSISGVKVDSAESRVNLHNHGLVSLPVLPNPEKLLTLVLSFNQIVSLDDFEEIQLPNLVSLDLSYNKIETLKGTITYALLVVT